MTEQGVPVGAAEAVARWAASAEGVQAVWFFGSRAKSLGRPDSDLDIAVRTAGPCPSEAAGHWIALGPASRIALAEALPDVKVDVWGTGPGWGSEPDTEQEIVWPAVLGHGLLVFEAWPGAALQPYEMADP